MPMLCNKNSKINPRNKRKKPGMHAWATRRCLSHDCIKPIIEGLSVQLTVLHYNIIISVDFCWLDMYCTGPHLFESISINQNKKRANLIFDKIEGPCKRSNIFYQQKVVLKFNTRWLHNNNYYYEHPTLQS